LSDFSAEFGRYFVCECKGYPNRTVGFQEIAKFCRVLDSTKATFGIVFSQLGLSGQSRRRGADLECAKVYQDRGIVIVSINRTDIEKITGGANFVTMLREKYEAVRLDLRS
jgi:hypothetical protein